VSKELRKIPQSLWDRTPKNVFRTDLTLERLDELELLREHAIEFKEICRISYGAQISSKEKGAFGRDRYLARGDDGMTDPKKFYEGSNMRPFGMAYDGYYVDMAHRAEMYGPRTPGFFENDKLSVRHISGDFDSFVAWVDEEHYYTDHGVIHAVPYYAIKDEMTPNNEPAYNVTAEQDASSRRYPLFYLLGIMMSRPALELYAELYATGSLQGAFSHVYPDMVKGLPIPELGDAPASAPDDWFDRLSRESSRDRISRAGVTRALEGRAEIAAVLAAAAQRRQDLELDRRKRSRDFVDFMGLHSTGWHWASGESLESPPDETVFLQSVGDDLISLNTMKAVRSEFQDATQAANADATEAIMLERMIDALAATLYSTRA
jgi:hypothetical protein